MGCHLLLQEIFLTQGLNPGLLHCRQTLYCLSHQGSPCLVAKLCPDSLQPHGVQRARSLLKLMSIESVILSNYLILCLSLCFLPSIFPSIRVFSYGLALCIRWPKYSSYSICPSSLYSRLISFRVDWFDLFAVHRTQESSQVPQFESIFFFFFFGVQPSLWSNSHICT